MASQSRGGKPATLAKQSQVVRNAASAAAAAATAVVVAALGMTASNLQPDGWLLAGRKWPTGRCRTLAGVASTWPLPSRWCGTVTTPLSPTAATADAAIRWLLEFSSFPGRWINFLLEKGALELITAQ